MYPVHTSRLPDFHTSSPGLMSKSDLTRSSSQTCSVGSTSTLLGSKMNMRPGRSASPDSYGEMIDISRSSSIWKLLKRGIREFVIAGLETIEERNAFHAEIQDAEEQGFSVEYVNRGGQIVVMMETKGDKLGKACAKKEMDRTLDGGNFITYRDLILRASDTIGPNGQLIPDICRYPTSFTYDFRGDTPPHPHIAVEIEWIEESQFALNKVNAYFAPSFVAPDASMVMEVWTLFLASAAPAVPALTVPVHTEPLSFTGLEFTLNAATALRAEEPTIIVFHHRHDAYQPSYGVLDWNTSLAAPTGSSFTGRLDANTILRMVYLSKTQSLE